MLARMKGMIRISRKEPSVRCYFFRWLVGLAAILDGLVATLTLGIITSGFTLEAARYLALKRMQVDARSHALDNDRTIL